MNYTIRPVTERDAAELLTIYAPYVINTAVSFEYEVPTEEEFRNRIRTISERLPYLAALDEEGRICGYAYAAPFKTRRAYDWSVEATIYLRENCRRQGLGSMLYGELERLLREMGILNMNACIAVPAADNDEHLTKDSPLFHESMGFRTVGTFRQSGYKFDTWYDMIWMEKLLGEHGKQQTAPRFGEWKKHLLQLKAEEFQADGASVFAQPVPKYVEAPKQFQYGGVIYWWHWDFTEEFQEKISRSSAYAGVTGMNLMPYRFTDNDLERAVSCKDQKFRERILRCPDFVDYDPSEKSGNFHKCPTGLYQVVLTCGTLGPGWRENTAPGTRGAVREKYYFPRISNGNQTGTNDIKTLIQTALEALSGDAE